MILSILPYAHERGGVAIAPEDVGKAKARGIQAMEEQVSSQLKQIYGQVEVLARQAREIRRRAEISYRLYEAAMGYEPLIGHVYYLYEKEGGIPWISLIGPEERLSRRWRHLATVKLLADHTWEILEDHREPVAENSVPVS
jgi:hypothetical protein